MQAIIVSFDSLAANSLGCYGNDWIETPHWDRFATNGAVFDRHFADVVDPFGATDHSNVCPGQSWATGRHSLTHGNAGANDSLGSILKSRGISTQLVTSGSPTNWQRAVQFHAIQVVEGHAGANVPPDQIPFAHVVRAGLSARDEPSRPRLLWLHSTVPAIPPKGFDSLYFEDFEERGVDVAGLSDEAFRRHPAVYGGSVSLIDHWLGEFLQVVESDAEPTLVILTAAQGHLWQPIGPVNSGNVSNRWRTLVDQRTQAPLVLRVLGDTRSNDARSLRSDRLVQTCDLVPTLLDWFSITPEPSKDAGRSWLKEVTEQIPPRPFIRISGGSGMDAVRTADWLCILERDPSAKDNVIDPSHHRVSLFAKPEDIWDVNDVASQQTDVVTELLGHLEASSAQS